MEKETINNKFFNFLATSKNIAMTDAIKKKIEESLSLESEEIASIKPTLFSSEANVDNYEFAYNYFDKELNLFKYAKKEQPKYTNQSTYNKDADINPIVKNAREIITAICAVGTLFVTAYLGSLKGGSK